MLKKKINKPTLYDIVVAINYKTIHHQPGDTKINLDKWPQEAVRALAEQGKITVTETGK